MPQLLWTPLLTTPRLTTSSQMSTTGRYEKTPCTKKLERELSETLKHLKFVGELLPGLRKRLNPSDSYIPQLCGLPMIHKDGIPLHPIVSTLGSIKYSLGIGYSINPLISATPSHILNSTHFVQVSRNVKHNDKDLMVSFDLCSLFTKVWIDEAMLIVAKKLEEGQSLADKISLTLSLICQLTELCLRKTYSPQNGKLWEECDGAAMVSTLCPVVANFSGVLRHGRSRQDLANY